MNCLIAREKVPVRAPRPASPTPSDLCELVETLRCWGYAVHLDISCAETRAQVSTRAARFVESALAVAGNPTSGHAYVRVSGSTKSLFVEVNIWASPHTMRSGVPQIRHRAALPTHTAASAALGVGERNPSAILS